MISFTNCSGRPKIAANWLWVQPRALSSSFRYSPGKKASAGLNSFGIIVTYKSVIVLDGDNDNCLALLRLLNLEDEPELVVQSHGSLMAPRTFQLFKMQASHGIQIPFIFCGIPFRIRH